MESWNCYAGILSSNPELNFHRYGQVKWEKYKDKNPKKDQTIGIKKTSNQLIGFQSISIKNTSIPRFGFWTDFYNILRYFKLQCPVQYRSLRFFNLIQLLLVQPRTLKQIYSWYVFKNMLQFFGIPMVSIYFNKFYLMKIYNMEFYMISILYL